MATWPDVDGINGRATLARPDEVAAIEADLARARERVAASVRALGDEVARRGDWRGWVRARPTLAVAAALTLGFFMGRGLGRGLRAPTVNDTRRR
jgi:hypothetical protein